MDSNYALTCLFIEELEVGGTLILDVFRLVGLVIPVIVLLPFLVILFVVIITKLEIFFFLRLFTVWQEMLVYASLSLVGKTHSSWQQGASGRDARCPGASVASPVGR